MGHAEQDGGGSGNGDDLTEVEIIPITFVTACHVTVVGPLVHFTGWQETSSGEKRIVVRTVLSEAAVRQMVGQINMKLPRQN